MPRVRGFTAEQKADFEQKKIKDRIIRELHAYKSLHGLSYDQMGKELSISHGSLHKLMTGQLTGLTIEQWLRALHMAGMTVTEEDAT